MRRPSDRILLLIVAWLLVPPAVWGQAAAVEAVLGSDGTLRVTGTEQADRVTIRVVGLPPNLLEVDDETISGVVAEYRFDFSRIEKLVVSAGAGDDRIVLLDPSQAIGRAGKPLQISGGPGDDRIDMTGFGILQRRSAAALSSSADEARQTGARQRAALRRRARRLHAFATQKVLESQGAFLGDVHEELVVPSRNLERLGDQLVARAIGSWARLARLWAGEEMRDLLEAAAPQGGALGSTRHERRDRAIDTLAARLADLEKLTGRVSDPEEAEARDLAIAAIEDEMARLEASVDPSPRLRRSDRRRATTILQRSAEVAGLFERAGARAQRDLAAAAGEFEARVRQELLGGSRRVASLAQARLLSQAGAVDAEARRLMGLLERLEPSLPDLTPDVSSVLEPEASGSVVVFSEPSFDCGGNQVNTITDEEGKDEILGTPFADLIHAGDGDDLVAGFGGDDRILGGDGDDVLAGGAGRDEVHGEADDDWVLGNRGDDCLWGEDGEDVILGDDPILGIAGHDAADGGAGFDIIFGLAGRDLLVGSAGEDLVFGNDDVDEIHGDDRTEDPCAADEEDSDTGIDVLFGNRGDDDIFGGGGVTTEIEVSEDVSVALHLGNLIFGNRGEDDIYGGPGIDVVFGNRQNDTIDGCAHIDVLFGNLDHDDIRGGEGGTAFTVEGVPIRLGNVIFGNRGNDQLRGGPDLDVVFGNRGADTIFGGDGSFLLLGIDTDLLFGNAGEDVIDGGLGRDWVFGNAGDDVVRGDDGSPRLLGRSSDWVFGNRGEDLVDGGSAEDVLFGNRDDDEVIGGRGLDLLFGNRGCDDLRGGNALDVIFGNQHHDILAGNRGPDLLFGNRGQDTLSGGTTFDFLFGNRDSDALDGGDGADLVAGNRGDDGLRGGDGFLNVLVGNRGEDQVFATGGSLNVLSGDHGDDCVQGWSSFDVVLGGQGHDCLAGGGNTDLLLGGVGSDTLFGDGGSDLMWGDIPRSLAGPGGLLGPAPRQVCGRVTSCDDRLVGGPRFDLIRGGPGMDIAWARFLEFPRVETRISDGPLPPRCQCLFRDVRPGCIGGVKFHDLDGDGVQDASEPGLGGWTIEAVGQHGGRGEAVTGPDGSYSICCLPADRYEVREVLQPGWSPTEPASGSQSVQLSPAQKLTGIDFGNVRPVHDCPGVSPTVQPGCIEGAKFIDEDGDGELDPFEARLDGWTITVTGTDGQSVVTVTEGGRYSVCCLPPGTYEVEETLQEGWFPENPRDGSHTVEVHPGEVVGGVDFANRRRPGGCPDPGDPAVHYASTFPPDCDPGFPPCAPDQRRFDDACGCGCIDVANLELAKTCRTAEGRFLGCTLEIRNTGRAASATPLVLEDELPPGFHLQTQGTDSSCTPISETTLRCTLGGQSLAPGESLVVRINAQGDPSLGYENCASLLSPDDPRPGDDRSCFRGCPDASDSRVSYFFDDPAACAAAPLPFTCAPTEELFDDQCGCGCIRR